jgi:hypothetical protein
VDDAVLLQAAQRRLRPPCRRRLRMARTPWPELAERTPHGHQESIAVEGRTHQDLYGEAADEPQGEPLEILWRRRWAGGGGGSNGRSIAHP